VSVAATPRETPNGGGRSTGLLGSVVIPAHNEEAVIERCLDALFADVDPPTLDVVVVCNGCQDRTAALARACGHPVTVLELPAGAKPAALRAGDTIATGFPRIYLDADVVLDGASAIRVLARLSSGAVAARPPISYDAARSSRSVRGYYRARSRMPALHEALWGAGVYGLSELGRKRFAAFPDLVADDLWVDRHFGRGEVEIVDCAPVRVVVPRCGRDLVRILRRTYRGKGERMPAHHAAGQVPETLASTLHDLVSQLCNGPRAALDGVTYAAFAIVGRIALRLARPSDGRWERDERARAA